MRRVQCTLLHVMMGILLGLLPPLILATHAADPALLQPSFGAAQSAPTLQTSISAADTANRGININKLRDVEIYISYSEGPLPPIFTE